MHCPYCGFKVEDGFLYCPKCGKFLDNSNSHSEVNNHNSYTEPFYKQAWFTCLMLFVCFPLGLILTLLFRGKAAKVFAGVVLALFFIVSLTFFLDEHKSNEQFVEIYSTVSTKSSPRQSDFNEIQKRYEIDLQKAKTDLEKAEINRNYEIEFNNFLKERNIENWFARVYNIESEENGKAAHVILECDFPKAKYKIETKQFGINKALIPYNSELYKKIISLKSGDFVLVSGKLLNSEYGNSNKIIDLSVSYGDKNEKILVKFSDINLVKPKE